MLIIQGLYNFHPKRIAFRNDYCLKCASARRSVQIRTFDAWHVFYIPLIPLGFRKRWHCSVCGSQPHVYPGTRRGFKWAGLVVLLIFTLAFWAMPLTPDIVPLGWIIRFGAPLGAGFTLIHLLRSRGHPSLREKLAAVPPAADTDCPFCGTNMLMLSSECVCPKCGIRRL